MNSRLSSITDRVTPKIEFKKRKKFIKAEERQRNCTLPATSMSRFSCEIFTEILRWLLLTELCRVRTVCRQFDGVVQCILLARARDVSSPFIEDGAKFWKILREAEGAVVGHCPLWFFDPFTIWRPTVMTILLPLGRANAWRGYLKFNG